MLPLLNIIPYFRGFGYIYLSTKAVGSVNNPVDKWHVRKCSYYAVCKEYKKSQAFFMHILLVISFGDGVQCPQNQGFLENGSILRACVEMKNCSQICKGYSTAQVWIMWIITIKLAARQRNRHPLRPWLSTGHRA